MFPPPVAAALDNPESSPVPPPAVTEPIFSLRRYSHDCRSILRRCKVQSRQHATFTTTTQQRQQQPRQPSGDKEEDDGKKEEHLKTRWPSSKQVKDRPDDYESSLRSNKMMKRLQKNKVVEGGECKPKPDGDDEDVVIDTERMTRSKLSCH